MDPNTVFQGNGTPIFSPDGNKIYYVQQEHANNLSAANFIMVDGMKPTSQQLESAGAQVAARFLPSISSIQQQFTSANNAGNMPINSLTHYKGYLISSTGGGIVGTDNNESLLQPSTTVVAAPVKQKRKRAKRNPNPMTLVRIKTEFEDDDSSSSTKVRCEPCDKVFNKAAYLTQHNKTFHSGDKPFKCQRCGKRFPCEDSLQEHFNKHIGDKPFKCSVCPKQFNHKIDLRRHDMCLHSSNMMPHTCGVCGKGFPRKDHLRKHSNTHRNESPTAVVRKSKNGKNSQTTPATIT